VLIFEEMSAGYWMKTLKEFNLNNPGIYPGDQRNKIKIGSSTHTQKRVSVV